MSAELHVSVFRLEFRTRDSLRFPPVAGNALRGALGLAIDEKVFRPAPREDMPSGFQDPPRGFVVRARDLNARTFQRGRTFVFHLHVFQPGIEANLVKGFADALVKGFGPWRARAELEDCTRENLTISLAPASDPVSAAKVRFVSPTDLKGFAPGETPPPFPILFARMRDRIGALFTFYGTEPLHFDFKGLAERSGEVSLSSGAIEMVEADRHSSRTGQRHSLGGFMGEALYAGALAEFMPWLKAAEYTGIGRHTVWGLGEIKVELPA